MAKSDVSKIVNYPADPVEFFKLFLVNQNFITMNLATIDDEFGVLNRTVAFTRLVDNCISYTTQKYSRNCQNLLANPKAGITFYFPEFHLPTQGAEPSTWQIRLLGATAVELPEQQLEEFWLNESLLAQIRAKVFPCGQPVDFEELKAKHDELLNEYLKNGKPLERPVSYTVFKFQPQRWDFLKADNGKIADRVQYRMQDNGKWLAMHVAT